MRCHGKERLRLVRSAKLAELRKRAAGLNDIINHADDRIIITDLTFVPVLASIRDQIPA